MNDTVVIYMDAGPTKKREERILRVTYRDGKILLVEKIERLEDVRMGPEVLQIEDIERLTIKVKEYNRLLEEYVKDK